MGFASPPECFDDAEARRGIQIISRRERQDFRQFGEEVYDRL